MRTHMYPHLFVRKFRRLFTCLVLLFLLGLLAASPKSITLDHMLDVSPREASANLTGSDWNSIFQIVQADVARGVTHQIDSIPPLAENFVLIDQWYEQARMFPSNPTAMMSFGYSIDMDGDTVVVGAYWNHNPVVGGGAAYVFVKPPAGWPFITQAAKLTASDSGFHDAFGWSVAISGNTIVVGALDDEPPTFYNQGSAYVFVKPGGGWTDMTETAKLTASDAHNTDEFGRHVDIDGDTIVVGVPFDDIGTNADQGSVYVFSKPVGGWTSTTETAKLTTSDGTAGNLFGYSAAISGNTIVAGAYGLNHGLGVGEGQAYIFNQSGGWVSGTENARLTALVSADHEYFGFSAAIDGDTVVIGAPGGDTFDGTGSDSAYVFIKPAEGWNGDLHENAILSASDGNIADDFADSVAVSGDVVVVGAPKDDIGDQGDQGSAYVFAKPESGWLSMTETDKLTASDGLSGDMFGISVSTRNNTIAIGASKNSLSDNDDIGSAYIFDPQPIILIQSYVPIIVR